MFIPTDYFLKTLLGNGKTSVTSADFAGVLSGAKVGVFTNNITPSGITAYGDLTQPAYSGYVEQAAAFGGVYRRKEGGFGTLSAQLRFHEASTITVEQCYGAYLTDGAVSPALLGVEVFPGGPKMLNDADDSIFASMQVALGGPNWGVGEYSD